MCGSATCSQPLASSRAAECKTPSALQLPCQSSRCQNRDSDGNCTRLVMHNSELPVRKVTSSSFSFLLWSEIPNAAKNTTVLSFSLDLLLFQRLVYTSSTLVCSSQLEKRAVALVFPWQQGCGWSPRSGWKHPEVCRDGAAFLSDALPRNLGAAFHRGAIFSNKPHVCSPKNDKRGSCSSFWRGGGGVERDPTERHSESLKSGRKWITSII